jgi:hypothetical protein
MVPKQPAKHSIHQAKVNGQHTPQVLSPASMSCQLQCGHCRSFFKGERGLSVHRSQRPACENAYLRIDTATRNISNVAQRQSKRSKQNPPAAPAPIERNQSQSEEECDGTSLVKEVNHDFPIDNNSISSMELQTTNFDIETDASLTDSDERLSSRLTTEPLVGHINTTTQRNLHHTSNLAHEGFNTDTANPVVMEEPDNSLLQVYDDLMANKEMDEISGLSMLTVQEKVQVDLLRTLRRLKAPLITFEEVLNWVEKPSERSNDDDELINPSHVDRKICPR